MASMSSSTVRYTREFAPRYSLTSSIDLPWATNSRLVGKSMPMKHGYLMGGEETLTCIALAPEALSFGRIFLRVSPPNN